MYIGGHPTKLFLWNRNMSKSKKLKSFIVSIRDVTGGGPLGYGLCIVCFLIFWKIDEASGFGGLWGNKLLHQVLAGVLLIASVVIFYAAFRAMPISKHNKCLVKNGVYSYIRHPRYAAAALLVYPAFGLLAHSFLCLVSTFAAYIIFRLSAALEERKLVKVFGQEYKDYMNEVGGFIPKIRNNGS